MGKFYKDLKASLEEAIEYRKGNVKLTSELIEVPEPPEEYRAREIKKIREKRKYSQSFFAKILNVSVRTVQSWETGKRHPTSSALRLLEIIDKNLYHPGTASKKS